jgi:hypothetical protein
MTLQAEETALAPKQQIAIHRAVRSVTGCASFYLDRCVFENERTALLGMTVDACFPIRFAKHRLIVRAVRIVAVRAFHLAFRNAMMRRKRELSLNGPMAGVTQNGLRLAQHAFIQPSLFFRKPRRPEELCLRYRGFHFVSYAESFSQMRRMTVLARNAGLLVMRSLEQRLILAGAVALQTASGVLVGFTAKTEDQCSGGRDFGIVSGGCFDRLHVRSSRTMAAFAPCAVCGAGGSSIGVSGLIESLGVNRVTTRACIFTDVVGSLPVDRRFPHDGRRHGGFGLTLSENESEC